MSSLNQQNIPGQSQQLVPKAGAWLFVPQSRVWAVVVRGESFTKPQRKKSKYKATKFLMQDSLQNIFLGSSWYLTKVRLETSDPPSKFLWNFTVLWDLKCWEPLDWMTLKGTPIVGKYLCFSGKRRHCLEEHMQTFSVKDQKKSFLFLRLCRRQPLTSAFVMGKQP